MASCVLVDTSGALLLDQAQQNLGECQYVLQSGAEWVNGSLLAMSPSDGAELAGLVCLLWSVAWGIKQAINTLYIGETHVEKD